MTPTPHLHDLDLAQMLTQEREVFEGAVMRLNVRLHGRPPSFTLLQPVHVERVERCKKLTRVELRAENPIDCAALCRLYDACTVLLASHAVPVPKYGDAVCGIERAVKKQPSGDVHLGVFLGPSARVRTAQDGRNAAVLRAGTKARVVLQVQCLRLEGDAPVIPITVLTDAVVAE